MGDNTLKKIRCKECGNIIAFEVTPIEKGEITIMCNNRKPNGQRCKTVNVIKPNTDSHQELN